MARLFRLSDDGWAQVGSYRPHGHPLGRAACRRHNRVERPFGDLKNWRRVATRHDRATRNDLALTTGIAACT